MFFITRKVQNWDDQLQKWWTTWIWQFTPIPYFVFIVNLLCYIYDGLSEQTEEQIGTFPSMYRNSVAEGIMTDNEIWGPFAWYDMFTRMGWLNWYLNALTLDFAIWWEIYLATEREEQNDW